ncbi:hypothetical protein XH99_01035 [Bradyrhizobium nanningense]|uniref:Uncharacterized protein n=1 Tax=Bradyrhizobium nanningense TaxID=1325118 RepID=A0A4Q0SKW3_9BRAD|nr:hypothetical protein [Bradyrhizobium nanningense]RXH34362.1 hypothetical protein XH84_06995 [Bradyrhizobium nanningense]RXH38376.1 hypothetical protein XH99_01035 [Bradyrhizobium nanningense]
MGQLSRNEDAWQAKATATAVAEARKVATSSGPLMNTPVGRLSDLQWGVIIAGALFGWIATRCQQAIAEGWDQENAVELGGFEPSPADVAAVKSILPLLADQAGIDWSKPLETWSKDTMTDFLLLAWRLVSAADVAREHGPGILRKANTKVVDSIPF